MKKKVCLITGGAGFLGKKFCEFFAKKNYKVFCIDNNKKNLNKIKLLKLKNITVIDCDISKHAEVKKLYNWANLYPTSWRYHTANSNKATRKKGNEIIITNY